MPNRCLAISLAIVATFYLASTATADIIHHYALDDNANDSIGSLNGTIVDPNAPTSGAGILFQSDVPAVGSGYLHKDDDYGHAGEISLGTGVTFANGEAWSTTFWSKRFSTDGNGPVVSPLGDHSDNDNYIRFRSNQNQDIEWGSNTSGVVVSGAAGTGLRSTTDWTHFAAVSDGTTVSLYRDGVLVGSGTPADTGWVINSIGRGRQAGGQSRRSDFDDVAIFDSALSADQLGLLIDIADTPGLEFDAGEFGLLYNQYLDYLEDDEADPIDVGGLTWNATEGLGTAVGIFEENGDYTVVFDTNGIGVTTASLAAVPEPASLAAWAILLLSVVGYRRWNRKA